MIVAWEAFLQELQEYLRLPCVLRDVGRSGVLNCSPTFTKREQPNDSPSATALGSTRSRRAVDPAPGHEALPEPGADPAHPLGF